MDGKGLLPAILIAIFTAEAYTYMRKHNWGRIKLPDSVPAALSETFASLVPWNCSAADILCITCNISESMRNYAAWIDLPDCISCF